MGKYQNHAIFLFLFNNYNRINVADEVNKSRKPLFFVE